MNKFTLTAIVPAFNEERFIEESIGRLQKLEFISKILVIDDNSSDATNNIVKNLSLLDPRIHLYKLDVNKGKGGALNFARPYIDTDFVVIHDADLEYFPDDIELMYQELNTIDSFVLGSRFLGEKKKIIYLRTYLANKLFSKMFSIVHRVSVTDVATCYKMMPSKYFIETEFKENGFAIEIEILAKFIKQYKREILEVPIKYEARSYEDGKKINTLDGIRYLYTILKFKFF